MSLVSLQSGNNELLSALSVLCADRIAVPWVRNITRIACFDAFAFGRYLAIQSGYDCFGSFNWVVSFIPQILQECVCWQSRPRIDIGLVDYSKFLK